MRMKNNHTRLRKYLFGGGGGIYYIAHLQQTNYLKLEFINEGEHVFFAGFCPTLVVLVPRHASEY